MKMGKMGAKALHAVILDFKGITMIAEIYQTKRRQLPNRQLLENFWLCLQHYPNNECVANESVQSHTDGFVQFVFNFL
jgi:hypothetical protein